MSETIRLRPDALGRIATAALPIAREVARKRRDRNSPSAFVRWDALERLMVAFEEAGVDVGRKGRQA